MLIAEPRKLVMTKKYYQVIFRRIQSSQVQILLHNLHSKLSNNNKRRNNNHRIRIMNPGTQTEQIFKKQNRMNNLKNELFILSI
jgi:uncharacterized circularly permuted ATP-grasp superfamily protein